MITVFDTLLLIDCWKNPSRSALKGARTPDVQLYTPVSDSRLPVCVSVLFTSHRLDRAIHSQAFSPTDVRAAREESRLTLGTKSRPKTTDRRQIWDMLSCGGRGIPPLCAGIRPESLGEKWLHLVWLWLWLSLLWSSRPQPRLDSPPWGHQSLCKGVSAKIKNASDADSDPRVHLLHGSAAERCGKKHGVSATDHRKQDPQTSFKGDWEFFVAHESPGCYDYQTGRYPCLIIVLFSSEAWLQFFSELLGFAAEEEKKNIIASTSVI